MGPAADELSPQQVAQLREFASALTKLDYFQLLRVDVNAVPADIKKAFHRESRTFHPDRFFHIKDADTKSYVNQIYKRITEAYYVLRDDAKRRKYQTDIQSPARLDKLRFNEDSEAEQKAEQKKAQDEEFGGNAKSRPFFKAALADCEKENWAAAERNLKTAMTFDPSNPRIKEKLAEVAQKVEEQRRGGSGAR
jgi:curved DNA-binding protein CbpA